MDFADLKNDYIFRRIFGTHPGILCGLLNDLLERTGDQAIETIEYLPNEQLPLVAGAKLSILDVRCKDRAGTKFVVEMQLIHVKGFINRVIYNACKGYADQLKKGKPFADLTDVVAISICDFELWPDAEQDAQNLRRVPMLSRWYVTERSLDHGDPQRPRTGSNTLLQVQYAFLELPKLPKHKPDTGALQWAWLFVHAPELTAAPDDLLPGPYREALELANQAKFTQAELDAYQKAMDEIQQAREYGEAKEAEGFAKGKRDTLLRLLVRAGIALTDHDRARIEACTDAAILDRWVDNVFGAKTITDVLS
jgi:hypothetical protein